MTTYAPNLTGSHPESATHPRRGLRRDPPVSDRLADRLFEAHDVAAGEPRRRVGVTGDDRLDQRSVFLDVAGHVVEPVHEQAPDAGRQIVVADEGVLRGGVVRGGDDGAVDVE